MEKWKLSSGSTARRQSELMTFESAGKDTYSRSRTKPDDTANDAPPQVWIVDGKQHKAEIGDGDTHTIDRIIERINERHLKISESSAQGSTVLELVVSPSGNTLTMTRKGTGTNSGRPVDELLVYDRK